MFQYLARTNGAAGIRHYKHSQAAGAGASGLLISRCSFEQFADTIQRFLCCAVLCCANDWFLFDALILPDGKAGVQALALDGHTKEFIKDQYRHCKPMLVLGASSMLLEKAGIPATLINGEPDQGLILATGKQGPQAGKAFIKALSQHRIPERETDPPLV